MKKQMLIFTGVLLINSHAFCMRKPAAVLAPGEATAFAFRMDQNGAMTNLNDTQLADVLNSTPALMSSIQEVFQRLAVSVKEEQDFDPKAILNSFSSKSKEIQSALQRCSQLETQDAANEFVSEHEKLEADTQAFYSEFFAKEKLARVCATCPAFNTLLLRTQRIHDQLPIFNNIRNPTRNSLLRETIGGFLQSLKDTKDLSKK